MGNALTEGVERIVVEDDSPLKDYKNATTSDYAVAKSNFDTLQETFGDKMTVTEDEFDEIFALICQDASEHFKLFDHWELGKVDVMEVFAVILVYCKCSMDEKIPLLFDLFDFDHSKEISESELVLLMLCTTRGLCKVVGLDRPDTVQLEELAQSAFASIDRDHSGQISLAEFAQWATHEPSLMVYLKRFASARLIYDNQVQYDAHMKQLCDQFLTRGGSIVDARGRKQLACSLEQCAEILHKHFPATTRTESAYLVETMQRILLGASTPYSGASASCLATTARVVDGFITLDVFGMVASSYVAFIVADEDQQHAIDLKELKILLWLMRGKEPTLQLVSSVMKSLDRDQNGVLSALEWVSYAVESDARTGNFSFATQIQLLFTCADRNGDALLTIQELITGLKPILLESLCKQVTLDAAAQRELEREWGLPNDNEDAKASGDEEEAAVTTENPKAAAANPGVGRRQSQANTIHVLVTSLANEFMATLDKNQSHRIEWFEFRQHLDYLEERIHETKDYIRSFVLAGVPPQPTQ